MSPQIVLKLIFLKLNNDRHFSIIVINHTNKSAMADGDSIFLKFIISRYPRPLKWIIDDFNVDNFVNPITIKSQFQEDV